MSKFALRGLCESIRSELALHGIFVTLISPGLIESEFRRVNPTGIFDESRKEFAPRFLLMSARQAAKKIIQGVENRKREAIITIHGKAVVFLNRLFPGLLYGLTLWLKKMKMI
jgi:short-subunit dehydrogenase